MEEHEEAVLAEFVEPMSMGEPIIEMTDSQSTNDPFIIEMETFATPEPKKVDRQKLTSDIEPISVHEEHHDFFHLWEIFLAHARTPYYKRDPKRGKGSAEVEEPPRSPKLQGLPAAVTTPTGTENKGTIWGSVANITSSTIGSGVLALPFAFSVAGSIWATFLLFVTCLCVWITLKFLLYSCRMTGHFSYDEVTEKLLGKRASKLVHAMIIFLCFGVLVAAVDIFCDLGLEIIAGLPIELQTSLEFMNSRLAFAAIFVTILPMPLSMAKSFHHLRFSSILSVLSVAYLLFALIVKFLVHGYDSEHTSLAVLNTSSIRAIPIFAYSLEAHVPMPLIAREASPKTAERFPLVIAFTSLFCFLAYMSLGLSGYLAFPVNTMGNILTGFSPQEGMGTIGCVAMLITVSCSFPFMLLPCRSGLLSSLLPSRCTKGNNGQPHISIHVSMTILLCALAVLCSHYIPNITDIFGLAGSIGSTWIIFLLPSIFYLKLVPREETSKRLLAMFIIALGCFIGVLSTVEIVQEMANR